MFSFSAQSIDVTTLRQRFNDDRAGALATFEGVVRNHNEGRNVLRLEYEAYEQLATNEAAVIFQEAREKFGVYDAICVHRTGSLEVGEVAVWVGVISAHRGEAFDACRYIIDEVKHRLPIWKKEHYVDGDSGWVNCQTGNCGVAHAPVQVAVQKDTPGREFDAQPPVADFAPQQSEADFEPLCSEDWQLDIFYLSGSDLRQFEVIDIRESDEEPDTSHLWRLLNSDVKSMPLSKFDVGNPPVDRVKKILFVSQTGQRSQQLVEQLRQQGFRNVFSLTGGVEAMRRKFIA